MDKRIDTAIKKWRKILLMGDWIISWKWNDALDHDAQVHVWSSEKRMELQLKHIILGYNEEEFEATVAHELIHALTWPIDDYIRPWIEEYFPNVIMVPFWRNFNDTAENIVVEWILRVLRAK